jgi:ABC-type cobalamin transport system permease subunit
LGGVHPLGNPHYWLDPDNGRRIARGIAQKLADMDPADSQYFQQRFQDFDRRLTAAEKNWDAEMAPYRGRKLVSFHNSWSNFAKHFGLQVVGYIEPRPGIPPTPAHTLEIIQLMKRDSSKFLLISIDPQRAETEGVSIRLWDFLFYASFGFVVTSSVAIAGVLLVFCYLIVPSVGAMLFADKIGKRLAIGWIMGTLVSALGVYLSVVVDLPTGATIVCTFGGVLFVMFLLHLVVQHRRTKAIQLAESSQRERSLELHK